MTGSLSGKRIVTGALPLIALALALWPPGGLTTAQGQALGIVVLTIGLWATNALPNYLPVLIFFAVVLIARLAPPDAVFAGFGSAAVWLIVSGFVIGTAIGTSGLGARLAAAVGPVLTGSYPRLIGGLMALAMALGFVMPSSVGRAVVLVPIGMALADRCGLARGSKGRQGVATVLAVGCNMPSFAILPSNIPNMILAGAAETIHGVSFGYTDYLLLHYPVLGIAKAAVTVALVLWLFPDQVRPTSAAEAAAAAPGTRALQWRTGLILLGTLALWMTDSLHGINPAWVGIATAVLLLLPRVGVVDPLAFRGAVDFGTVLFVAGALALGSLVHASGLGTMIGHALERLLPLAPGQDALNFLSLSAMAFLTGLVSTVSGVPAVLTPLAPELAQLSGFSLQAVLMTQVIGFSTVVFPYQIAPLVVAMQLSGERVSALTRLTLPLALATFVLLLPLDYLWWVLIGAI